jgi:dihydroorotase
VKGQLEITRPDDWHVHLRDGELLARVLPATARRFGRAVVMPNLDPPICTVEQARAYRERILACVPADASFEPLMTLYLTGETTAAEIGRAQASGLVHGVKLYPKGATTHSDAGVSGLAGLEPVLEALERHDLPLLVHGEATDPECDVFDRERVFLERELAPTVARFPGLRLVFEHITSAESVAFVREASARVGATITPQHLLLNRNALFEGGLRPHHYCVPLLKRETDRRALLGAATSGDPHFFLGTDSAPHLRRTKEAACGCAGVYSAPIALELYAEAFAQVGRIDRLEGFASHFGADFYGLPRNAARVRLVPEPFTGPAEDGDGPEALRIFFAGRPLRYRVVGSQGGSARRSLRGSQERASTV